MLKENLLSSQECKTTKIIVYSGLKHRKEDPDPEKGLGKPELTQTIAEVMVQDQPLSPSLKHKSTT